VSDGRYWASLPRDQVGKHLETKSQEYNSDRLVESVYERMYRAYEYYYGFDPSGIHATSQVLRGGDQGELAEIRVNHSRSLVNTLLNLIVAPKLVWSPKAVNIDSASLQACELSRAILEYYWSEKQVSKHAVQALEHALTFGEGFVLAEWDEFAGDDYQAHPDAYPAQAEEGDESEGDYELGAPAKTPDPVVKGGDIRYCNVLPWDVKRDPSKPSWDACEWVIVTVPRNRYALAKQYPESEYQILEHAPQAEGSLVNGSVKNSDDVPLKIFMHRPNAAIPTGRMVHFLSADIVLKDETMDEMPLYRVSAGELTGTPFGYTSYFDILGVQELMDSLHTTIASNQSTLGQQVIAIEEGSSAPVDEIAGGMKAIYYPPGSKPPEALQLLKTPGEIFTHLGNLKKEQELLLGLNSVVRGEAQSGEMSGSALALLQSQALQQSSTIQANYIRLVEGLGSCTLATLQKYCSVPRKIAIVGKGNQFLVQDTEYDGSSLERVKKVQVEVGNPLSQTSAGRIEMARDLLQMLGPKLTVEQYQQVLSTGRLEPLTQSINHELMLIRAENEALARGEVTNAVAFDDHQLHAREHRTVLANLQARRNPQVVDAVLAHISEHERAFYTTSPTLLALVGQTPPAAPPPPDMGGENDKGSQPVPPGQMATGPAPKPPDAPKNPATGQQWNPVDGGGAVPLPA
jgi:hypothetical protein